MHLTRHKALSRRASCAPVGGGAFGANIFPQVQCKPESRWKVRSPPVMSRFVPKDDLLVISASVLFGTESLLDDDRLYDDSHTCAGSGLAAAFL